MNDCIFCKIVAREIPADIVYEDEHTLAFLDIAPVNKGHTLVIPKEHVRNILDASTNVLTPIYETAKHVAQAQMQTLSADGVNVNNNNEAPAGQEVFHYHVHVIPRFEGDNLSHWPKVEYEEGETEETGAKLRESLKNTA